MLLVSASVSLPEHRERLALLDSFHVREIVKTTNHNEFIVPASCGHMQEETQLS